MKKFFISFVLIISLLFNVFADNKQAHKELREVFENYGLLPEMVEKGFSLDKLDEIDDPVEMRDYLQPFFMDENGMPLDNHASFEIKYDINGYVYKMANVKTGSYLCINFSDEYGSKDELLKKGYKEDEIFYYPYFNGEWKDGYRVGKKFMGGQNYDNSFGQGYCTEGKNSIYCKLTYFNYDNNQKELIINKISKSKKKFLILDLHTNMGGSDKFYFELENAIKEMNPKKIFIITSPGSYSMGTCCPLLIKRNLKIETIIIGRPGSGAYQGVLKGLTKLEFDNFIMTYELGGFRWIDGVVEGIGVMPDIFTMSRDESIEVVKYLTKDFELNIE